MNRSFSFCLLGVLCVLCGESFAAEPTYWQDIRPVLRKHCTVCHSAKNIDKTDVSAGLALDSPQAIRAGTKEGTKVVTPGNGADSRLIRLLRHKDPGRRMPLDAEPLPDETVALMTGWINAGLPEGTKTKDEEPPAVVQAPKRLRKLDFVLPTKTALPNNVAQPNQTGPLELVLPIGPLAPVAAVAYSPNGKLLATGSYGRVTVWDALTGRPVQVLTNVLGAVNDLKFNPDSSLLAVAGGQPSARGDLRIFATNDWKLLASLGGHADVVSCVSFSPDGKFLASASFDKTVRIWNMDTRQTIQTFTDHSDFVHAVAFGPKGDWLVTASKDRTARLIDFKTGASKLTFSGMEQDVLAVAVRPDGQQVVTSGLEPQLSWWNAQTGERIRKQGGHDVAVHEIAFAAAGDIAASAGADKTVRLWNSKNGESQRVIPVGSIVYAVALRPDGKQVAAGCFDGTVRVYETEAGRQLLTLVSVAGHSSEGDWLALTPEAFADGSDGMIAKAKWRTSSSAILHGEPVWKALRQPELIGKALRGEKLPEAVFAGPIPTP
jgi:WD40 repeat protein